MLFLNLFSDFKNSVCIKRNSNFQCAALDFSCIARQLLGALNAHMRIISLSIIFMMVNKLCMKTIIPAILTYQSDCQTGYIGRCQNSLSLSLIVVSNLLQVISLIYFIRSIFFHFYAIGHKNKIEFTLRIFSYGIPQEPHTAIQALFGEPERRVKIGLSQLIYGAHVSINMGISPFIRSQFLAQTQPDRVEK